MIDKKLQGLIDAPLADPWKIYLPEGRRKASRGSRAETGDDIGCPKLTHKALIERKDKALSGKINALLDYYATTDLPAERVAEHVGLYRKEQTGVSEDGEPIFARVLDVGRVRQQLAWRRAQAA